jgi:outer membrane protein assembly factor BamB
MGKPSRQDSVPDKTRKQKTMKPTPLNSIAILLASLALTAALKAANQPPPDLPAPVASFGAAATADGRVFIYGGHAGTRHKYNREEVNGDLYFWQAGMSDWKKLGAGEPAQGASLIALDNRVLRIGGMAAQNSKDEKQDLWSSETASSFELKSNTWADLPKFTERRSSHDSVVIGQTLYVIGGWALGGGKIAALEPRWHDTYLTLDLADPDAAWKSHPQPFERRALAVHALGSKLYAIGGMNSSEETVTSVDVLDTATGQWTSGPALPADKIGGFGFAAVAHENRLFASGAAGDLLELSGDSWTPVAKLAHPRFFHRLVPGGPGKLIALGGESRKGVKAPPEIIDLPAAAKRVTVSDWPGYQGPRGNSTTPETGFLTNWSADGPPVAWRAEVGIGLSSFAVAGERVITTGNDGKDRDTVFCFQLKTGGVLWQHTLEVPTKCHEMPIVPYGPAATPAIAGERVYFISREGHLQCLALDTGSLLWQKHLVTDLGGKRPVYGYASSPAVIDGRLYLDIGGQGGSTACLDAESGAVLWQTGDGEAGYSTPFITSRGGRDTLVIFKGEALELRDPATGELIAAHATTTRDFCNCATPIISGDRVFISHTGNMGARVLDWTDSGLAERWTDRDFGLLFHSGMPFGENHLLAFNDALRGGNDLRLIDLDTGAAVWKNQDIAKGTGLLTDDGHAILLTNLGEVVLARITTEGPDILATVQALPAKAWCQPALSQHHLLLKNNNGDVVCFNLASK